MKSILEKKRGRESLGLLLVMLPVMASAFQISKPHSYVGVSRLYAKKSFLRFRPNGMSSGVNEEDRNLPTQTNEQQTSDEAMTTNLLNSIQEELRFDGKLPPMKVDDLNLLYYDVFLLINLVVSISFWVVHRLDIQFLGSAFNEGCLLSLLWIGSGIFHGAFLDSAVDGHYQPSDERGGPKAAGLLGFHTYVNTINLRLVFALLVAVFQHREVGTTAGEQLIPLELGFGLVLMSFWRMIHSTFVPRF